VATHRVGDHRGIYEADALDGAVAAVRRADRAIPANIMLSTPQGPADMEVTLDGVDVLRPREHAGVLSHANHCLHPGLRAIADEYPDLIESRSRQARVDTLLAGSTLLSPDPAILRDHDGYPRSICRHPNTDPGTGHWRTVTAVPSVCIDDFDSRTLDPLTKAI
jgi:isopenicillin-N N-acyltransferase-like protein